MGTILGDNLKSIIMGLWGDIFLSKQDKQVVDVYNDIRHYWKNTNDFVVAHIRYLEDLEHKYKLNFSDEIINDLPYLILGPLLERGMSQINSMFIFSQFVVFYILRKGSPAIYRYSDENLLLIVENLSKILIPYKSRVTPEFSYEIDKKVDVIARFGNKNIKPENPERNSSNREFSKSFLASNLGCSKTELKQKVFEQLESMNANIEACKEVILRRNKTRFEQAKEFNIHPDDTPANLMIEMVEEYIEKLKSKKNSDDQIIREMASSNIDLMSELLVAKELGDINRIEELLEQNPDFYHEFIKKIINNEDEESDEDSHEDFDDDLPF